jgi:hypothetical protein
VRNQFGGVLGGPIVRIALLLRRLSGTAHDADAADIITFIPTAAMLNGDFSTVASAQCRAQGNLTLPAALGFVNNRIDPALLSPAAVKIAKMLPTTSDPCGQIAYRARPSRASAADRRVDWQSQPEPHAVRAVHARDDVLGSGAEEHARQHPRGGSGAGAGGRDNSQHSFTVGDTMVLSNTTVNNFRVYVNRTRILRTHADMFGPEDVGIKMFTYIPHYMNITTTGAFSINVGTETFSF